MAAATSARVRLPRAATVSGVTFRLWSSVRTRQALPLLVVHDGRGYARRAGLLDLLSAETRADRLPPLRAALLDTAARDEDYSASAVYTRRLLGVVLPSLPPATLRIGVGASLGALALLHAHVRAPGAFAALFLQSGSYFRGRTDPQENRFPRFRRISRFVAALEHATHEAAIPVTMTCGIREQNLANNRLMRDTLSAQGYPVRLRELPGSHNWPAWREALDPYLLELVREVAG